MFVYFLVPFQRGDWIDCHYGVHDCSTVSLLHLCDVDDYYLGDVDDKSSADDLCEIGKNLAFEENFVAGEIGGATVSGTDADAEDSA